MLHKWKSFRAPVVRDVLVNRRAVRTEGGQEEVKFLGVGLNGQITSHDIPVQMDSRG